MNVRISRGYHVTIVILFAALMLFSQVRANAVGSELILGDANCDGLVNTGDAVAILGCCVGIDTLSFYGKIAADVNSDMFINTGDAVLILTYTVADDNVTCVPLSLIADIENPIDYADFDYNNELLLDTEVTSALCEYTASAVLNPHGETAYAVGYTIGIEQGQTVTFETFCDDITFDTRIYIFDANMHILAYNDDGGDALFSRIEFCAGYSADYRVMVCGKSCDCVGDVTLSTRSLIQVTPVPTPTPTLTPTPTPTPEEAATYVNGTLPESGDVVQYRSPRTINGVITSKYPILNVTVEIYNNFGSIAEITASVDFNANDEVLSYTFIDGGTNSIDNQLAFSSLRFGQKLCKVFCSTTEHENTVVYSSNFLVGATDNLLAGNAYSPGDDNLGSTEREKILEFLNALPEDSIASQAVMNAFTRLGIAYGTGSSQLDCSSLVQYAYGGVGISLPRTAAEQGRYCMNENGEYSVDEIVPGDLVFFQERTCNCGRYMEIHHVALFVGEIDGTRYYIEASYGLGKIVLRRAWGETPTTRWCIVFYGRPY